MNMLHLSFSSTLCFSQIFFFLFNSNAFGIHKHFVLSFSFSYLGLRPYFFPLYFFCFSWPLAISLSFLFNVALGHLLFLTMQHAFHTIQQYNTNINASICYNHSFKHWSRWQKRIVNSPKGLNQRIIFGWLVFGSRGFRNEMPLSSLIVPCIVILNKNQDKFQEVK